MPSFTAACAAPLCVVALLVAAASAAGSRSMTTTFA